MLKGLIIINKYSTMPSMLHQASRIKEEFDKLGVEIEIVKNGYFPYLNDNCDIENTYKNIDFVVYLDKDKYQGELIEKSGIRCFNKISSITNCDDKMLTFIKLSGKGIKIPKTISAPLCYGDYDIDENSLKEVGDTLKYPLVLKLSFSSLGKGVFLINTFEELVETTKKYKREANIYQEYISSSYGMDIRVITVGGKVVCALKRVSKNDFRSNAALGGYGEKVELKKEYKDLAEKIAKELDLDYMGVDLLIGSNGEPILCEVNSNAFFHLAEEVTGVNVAKNYATYILNQIKK
ncbi:MAG: RimK family alpha-L-glutamate ligase [Clostridia bacterium]|nr:RimK family alpha-L-glutamate ligase [Clostridia bacterium]